eukprot:6409371-Prymnesium_polylepis.1
MSLPLVCLQLFELGFKPPGPLLRVIASGRSGCSTVAGSALPRLSFGKPLVHGRLGAGTCCFGRLDPRPDPARGAHQPRTSRHARVAHAAP